MTKILYTIYALIDPRDGSIRYIGITDDPDRRLKEHLWGDGNALKREWIGELSQLGLIPIMQTVETAPTLPLALERETYWIQYHLEIGTKLVNLRLKPYLSHIPRKENPSGWQKQTSYSTMTAPLSPSMRKRVTVKLDRLIADAGFRKTELACETGINVSTIVRICHGHRTTKATILTILKVLEPRLKQRITLDNIEGLNIMDLKT